MPPWLEAVNDRLRPFYRPSWNALRSRLLFDTDDDYRKTVFLSSGARMGSTWIAETINYRYDYRYLFEPITLRRLLATPAYLPLLPDSADGVVSHSPYSQMKERPAIDTRLQYVRPEDDDPELYERAAAVLSGRYHHPEIDQYNYTIRTKFDRRLVKETRTNLLLGWLNRRFPGMKIVLLTRHPIPTVQSRLEGNESKAGGRISYYRKLIFGQPDLVKDHLEPFRALLESADTGYSQRMAIWCIQNYVPLRQFAPGAIHVAFYEDFCVEPHDALRRLFSFLGDPIDDASLEKASERMSQRSSTVHARTRSELIEGGRVDGLRQISKWQKRVTDDERKIAAAMLTAFGLDAVYDVNEAMPNAEGARRLMRST
jgi:hypothetical protein